MLIQRMRDGTEGIMAKIIIGLIIIVFALFGFGSITTFLAPVASVATVNGEEITQQEMEVNVERRRRMMMARSMQVDEDQLREDVLDSLITRAVLSQAADELDLHYSDAAIDAEIVASEVFQLEGQFNAQQFQQVISGAGYSPLTYRAEMRTDKLFEQMISGVQESSFLTVEEATRYGGLLSQRRDIAYIQILVSDLLDEVEISEEEIAEYYGSNASDFVTEETVDLQYLELSRDELAAAYELDEAELLDYFNQNRETWSTDEARRMAHILIETSGDVSENDALEKAQGIYSRITEGEDFNALAQENSDDLGSRDNGGDLGFNIQGTFAPEFEAVAFDMALNQMSEPVRTDLGYHIIKLLGIEEANTPSLDDVRMEVEQAYRYEVTEDEFVSLSSRLAEMLFENPSEIESAASELGLEVRTTGHLTGDASHVLMSNAEVADAAFSPDVLLDGNNSDLIQISDEYHVGIRVAEHKPSTTRELDEVRLDIEYILQRQKATGIADEKARAIVALIRAGSLAQYAADQHGVSWTAVAGASRFEPEVEPFVLGEAFKLPRPAENKESLGTATLSNGDAVVMRVSAVINKSADDLQEAEIEGVQRSLSRQFGMIDFDEFQSGRRHEAFVDRSN